MIEHPRGHNDDVGATFWPDHYAPLTWPRCVTSGCDERVDPWDHNTRCPIHRADDAAARYAARLETVRAAVERGRRQTSHRTSADA